MKSDAVSARGGNQRTILVSVGNAAGIQGLDLTLDYDASNISIVDVQPVDRQSGYNAMWNASNGSLRIAFYGFAPLNEGSTVLAITFRAQSPNKALPPELVRAHANEGRIPMRIVGKPLLPPTSPPVVVGGTSRKPATKRE
jgi:hypothetical protein